MNSRNGANQIERALRLFLIVAWQQYQKAIYPKSQVKLNCLKICQFRGL